MTLALEIPEAVGAILPQGEEPCRRAILLELACGLYAAGKVTHAQAANLAGLGRLDFQEQLGLREIPIHYTLDDLKDDIAFARGE